MKVILSRKGFDSEYGGYSSPILNNKLLSLPIPSEDNTRYSSLRFGNKTYYDIMKSLKPRIKFNGGWKELTREDTCHLDPDIRKEVINRHKDWKHCFGQSGGDQTHLKNHGVKEGDLFLFFGWFRKAVLRGDDFKFEGPDLHVIFAYLQVGEIFHIEKDTLVPYWMKDHPHVNERIRMEKINAVYVARDKLSWNNNIPGAGVFDYDKRLVLTKEGFSRSKWALPDFFKNVKISRHSEKSWKPEGYFKSVDIGQEFVIEDNEKVEDWAKRLINNTKLAPIKLC